MSKSMVILAVPHQIQGVKFSCYADDPTYSILVEHLIGAGVDFVFEEATGRMPTIAEKMAESLLGPGHYLDVDPTPEDRPRFGIAKDTGENDFIPIDLAYRREFVDEHFKREKLWLRSILEQKFEKGLVICGLAHTLSFAFRLVSNGIEVPYVCSHIPYDKLCTRPHVK